MPLLCTKISNSKAIIKTPLYPKQNKNICDNNIALIGIGCNLGDCIRRFKKLFYYLKKAKKVKIIATSVIYKNPPFGYLEQPDFYNSLLLVETKLTPMQLLNYMQRIELHFGRKREFKNSPRTLDLDIILYNKQIVNKPPTLIIPHPYWKQRDSVLIPLKYLKGLKCLKRVL